MFLLVISSIEDSGLYYSGILVLYSVFKSVGFQHPVFFVHVFVLDMCHNYALHIMQLYSFVCVCFIRSMVLL